MSIRPGWFWHQKEEPHSLDRLFGTYLNSVGANTSFNLNVPPMPSGRFDPRDIGRLKELGAKIKESLGEEKVIRTKQQIVPVSETQCKFVLQFENEEIPAYVEVREDLTHGQRVETFQICAGQSILYQGTTIGNRKICMIPERFRKERKELTVFITSARDQVFMKSITIYRM